jgi:hypothetical protein
VTLVDAAPAPLCEFGSAHRQGCGSCKGANPHCSLAVMEEPAAHAGAGRTQVAVATEGSAAGATDRGASVAGDGVPAANGPCAGPEQAGITTRELPTAVDGRWGCWIQRCLVVTKAGRCVVNCRLPPDMGLGPGPGYGTSAAAAAAAVDKMQTQLAVGPLCRLLVTMHAFSGSGFLSYVVIDRFGVRTTCSLL